MSPAVSPATSSTPSANHGAGVLLALDSCGSRPGAALWDGSGDPQVVHMDERPPRAEGLAACVQRLIDAGRRDVSSITSLAVLAGPGSYTGLRTGLAFVRGLALLDSLPVAPVSALERLAFSAGVDGERVIAFWQCAPDLVVAIAYQIRDGLVVSLNEGGALPLAQLDGFVARCRAAHPGPWILALEHDHAASGSSLLSAIDGAATERRVVDSQTIGVLARLGYAKCERGLGVAADLVLPDYFGTSLPRSNRNRVAAPFAERVTY
ncbi:MAG: tRNA (adenosine(37)-N6)-threonylcarbamoyltransferase complex dimerization subunit type 1 TsaB [Deltaproteobacteria bacterium]|nr:tRNA (adenosine(37)-N6)-threonylcarbamoyltransferase complex dimerization subunit type 1 TsaB [Deltaproteobacteria bacterium]